MDWLIYFSTLLVAILVYFYFRIKKFHNYFEERNIPYIKAKYLLGSDPKGVIMMRHISDSWDLIYNKLGDNRVGGFFQVALPFLMIKDPNLVNEVLNTSFDYFFDRHFVINKKVNPLDEHLFFLKGKKWRYLRNKLSPFFTPSKLKGMQEEMDKVSDVFLQKVEELADGKDIDLLDVLACFTTDVIASCAFGIDSGGLSDTKGILRELGREIVRPGSMVASFQVLHILLSKLLSSLNIRTMPRNIENFFCSTIYDAMDYRRKTGATRKDFVQLLLKLKDQGVADVGMRDEEEMEENQEPNFESFELTDQLLAAQSFIFFLGGFETTSRTLHYFLFTLAKHQDVQDRLRKEIMNVEAKHGSFTHEALKHLTFLENCLTEILRLFPPIPFLSRECTKDYTLSDGTFIPKGLSIAIPILSIHRDSTNYPDPDKFDPDRFETSPQKGSYLPFGDGPRICIGKRFAIMEIKIIVARLLLKYKFEYSLLNRDNELHPRSVFLAQKHPLLVNVRPLKDC